VLDYAVYVSLDYVIYCACYSILFKAPFFPDTVYTVSNPLTFLTYRTYYSVSQKNPPHRDLTFFSFFHKRLRICNRLLNVRIFARLQIFIQLSPILTKLCHIKRDYTVHIICAKCPKRARLDVCVSHW